MILMDNIIAQILVRMQEGIIKKIHEKGLAELQLRVPLESNAKEHENSSGEESAA